MATEVRTTEAFPVMRPNYHAIFAGFIIAMGLQLALNLLGNAIGLALVSPAERATSAGPVLWALAVPLVCSLLGGIVAALMAGAENAGTGVTHGVLVWGIAMLFVAALFAFGAAPNMPARSGTIRSDAWWLAFFSACLALAGAAFGGYLGSRPIYRSVYMRELARHPA